MLGIALLRNRFRPRATAWLLALVPEIERDLEALRTQYERSEPPGVLIRSGRSFTGYHHRRTGTQRDVRLRCLPSPTSDGRKPMDLSRSLPSCHGVPRAVIGARRSRSQKTQIARITMTTRTNAAIAIVRLFMCPPRDWF
jgi:hypothetical protein